MCRWKDNIKMDFQDGAWTGWRTIVNAVMNLRVP